MTPPDRTPIPVTTGGLLDGRVTFTQPAHGFRSGIEPVLLAASVPAGSHERVLEAGTGSGAALLCLAARVSFLSGTGIERDPGLAALARHNSAANGWSHLHFVAADVAALPMLSTIDHAFANPPYHDAAGTASVLATREQAKRAPPDMMETWTAALARRLRPRGTLTFILPATLLPATLAAMSRHGCGSTVVFPLWPMRARAAKLVIVRAIKGGRAGLRLSPGLILHREDGGFTDAAEAVLRHAQPLPLD